MGGGSENFCVWWFEGGGGAGTVWVCSVSVSVWWGRRGEAVSEWFRLPPPGSQFDLKAATALAAAEGGYDLHEGLNFQMRPAPPEKVREGRAC